MDRESLAWAAGLFDGEGCFHLRVDAKRPNKAYVQIQTRMTQAHPEVLNRFQTAAFSPQPIPGNGHYVNLMFEQGAVPCSGKVPPVRIIDVGPADERLRSDVLPVLLRLRPHLSAESLQRIYRDGHPQGLRFTAVYEEDRCSQGLDLDSRVDREDAHRFYLREGPRKTAYHFARPVE